MKCQLCPNTIGRVYATLIGPQPAYTFQICDECIPKVDPNQTGYHMSRHDDGPPEEGKA